MQSPTEQIRKLDDLLWVVSIVAGLRDFERAARLLLPDADFIFADLGPTPSNEQLAAYSRDLMCSIAAIANKSANGTALLARAFDRTTRLVGVEDTPRANGHACSQSR